MNVYQRFEQVQQSASPAPIFGFGSVLRLGVPTPPPRLPEELGVRGHGRLGTDTIRSIDSVIPTSLASAIRIVHGVLTRPGTE